MNKFFLVSTLLACSVGSLQSQATQSTRAPAADAAAVETARLLSAAQGEAAKLDAVRLALAPIRSQRDLAKYLASDEGRQGPMAALGAGGQRRFARDLRFNEDGVTSFDYTELVAHDLTASQAHAVLSLLGVERTTPMIKGLLVVTALDKEIMALEPILGLRANDYPDYSCYSRKTCAVDPGAICTSNC